MVRVQTPAFQGTRSHASSLTAFDGGPLSGDIEVPGDKSISHRALILGALATGQTQISGLLEGDDVLHTANALEAFGARIDRVGIGEWIVEGSHWHSPAQAIDCGNSGTGVRLMMGAAAAFPIEVTFTGDRSLSSRPMERVLQPLRRMGAQTEGSMLPVTIRGGGLEGLRFMNERASAQVKSAILLAGLGASGEVEIHEPMPSRDHTENMLRAFGCNVQTDCGTIRLGSERKLRATNVRVPGDPSSAAFPIIAALLVPGSSLMVRNLLLNPLRTGLLKTLQEMGASIAILNARSDAGEMIGDVSVTASRLHGVEVPATRAPSMIDEYPILAVAAAFASGRTVMHGLSELRVKESNRLRAIIEGLQSLGVEAQEDGDSLVVKGASRLTGSRKAIETHDDHRIAMSFLVFGLAAGTPVTVNGAQMISTSFPGFVPLMQSIGAHIS